MTTQRRLDSVGWVFFGITLVVLMGPCIYFVMSVTSSALTVGTRVATGIIVAFFAAAFISWAVNSMLSYRAQRQDARAAPPSSQAAQQKRKMKK